MSENNNELSPPELEREQPVTEVTTPPETPPKRAPASADELWTALESEPDIKDELVEHTAETSGEEPALQSAKDKEYISQVTKNLAPVRELTTRVQNLEHTRNEFVAACQEIEAMRQRNEITEAQYALAVQNSKYLDVQIREESLNIQAHGANLQNHYKSMTDALAREFPEEWKAENREKTSNRIINMAGKMGLDKSVVIEGMEIPGVAQFFTKTLRMEQELNQLKKEALKRHGSQPAAMQSKISNLASESAKRQQKQNENVGYFGSKESQNSQLDQIDLLLRQNSK
jgi:hypothetical protein